MDGACPLPLDDYPVVLLAHGGGGRLMQRLLDELILPTLGVGDARALHDAARLDELLAGAAGRLAFTTDSYVVQPLFFPGGDIGSLAVCGTVNDLAMAGACARALSVSLILEEGLPMATLWQVLRSLRRAADGQLAVSALIGPWQMALVAVLGVVALFGTGLAGLALLVALRSTSPANVAPPAVTPAPAAPVVAFVIQMDQPMPTRVPGTQSSDLPSPNAPQSAPPSGAQVAPNAGPAIPIVSADQVTAPGQPTPVGQRQLRPIVVTTPPASGATEQLPAVQGSAPANASNSNLTYGQMFKEVASQFDLDWRVLAAQAYLESGFDSLALSGQGDMGLMQIRPGTWNEWAPTVDASDPFDSYSNVLVGAAYLNYLREQLSARGLSQQGWMLVAYNWGPEKVFSHIAAGGSWESLDAERRQYADDILRIAATIPSS